MRKALAARDEVLRSASKQQLASRVVTLAGRADAVVRRARFDRRDINGGRGPASSLRELHSAIS
jgi:hypothetical protein